MQHESQPKKQTLAMETWRWSRRHQERLGFTVLGVILLLTLLPPLFSGTCSVLSLHTCQFKFEPFAAIGTLIIAYFGYLHTREQLRLNLFEKRWAIYEELLKFLNHVVQDGGLNSKNGRDDRFKAAMQAAHNSFIGLGYHKQKALFGRDIEVLFEKILKTFAWLSVYAEYPGGPMSRSDWATRHAAEIMFINDTWLALPSLFRPYLFFGDHKAN